MTAFEFAHRFCAKWEGGLTDDAADRGGLTHWGVSIAFLSDRARHDADWLRVIGVQLPVTRKTIQALTREQAEKIFRRVFWDPYRLDELPMQIATVLYDCGVNAGMPQSVKLAQRGFNACMPEVHLVVDGVLGPLTRAALSKHCTSTVLGKILDARVEFYASIVKKRPSQKVFLSGWLNRVKDLRTYVGAQ